MKSLLFFFVLLGGVLFAYAFDTALPPLKESPAHKIFLKQPQSELSKLLFLLNRFKEAKAQVLYDGRHYKMDEAVRLAKDFLMRNYKKESAEYWIKKYCYKTANDQLILLETSDGETRIVRDVALEELQALSLEEPKGKSQWIK